eukprot:TRINITY_DN2586_c0_g1_i2.p1 TRINITY_DN2586_c0_g1~~TRINITY_DN2586_c0_g1_i2.p1  ORF type:complete len:132 (+),score=20.04 TRINITY_DN2586_c0_g1_i2:56-451(+)
MRDRNYRALEVAVVCCVIFVIAYLGSGDVKFDNALKFIKLQQFRHMTPQNFTAASTTSYTVTFNKDCATYTESNFISDVATAAGVDQSAIAVTSWTCGSIKATYMCRGTAASTAQLSFIAIATLAVLQFLW